MAVEASGLALRAWGMGCGGYVLAFPVYSLYGGFRK